MIRVPNKFVRLSAELFPAAQEAKLSVVDTSGVVVFVSNLLSGPSPWGLHQDYAFSGPVANILQGLRIVKAAEEATDSIVLQEDDHAALLKVLAFPDPSALVPMSPALARAIYPLLLAISEAEGNS